MFVCVFINDKMSSCKTESISVQPRPIVDFDADDFTNSSILEFLNQEKQCLDIDNGSEVDIESIFEEINRLSGDTQIIRDTDDINVSEILKEAEMLINKQELGELENKNGIKKHKKYNFKRKCTSLESNPREMKTNDKSEVEKVISLSVKLSQHILYKAKCFMQLLLYVYNKHNIII